MKLRIVHCTVTNKRYDAFNGINDAGGKGHKRLKRENPPPSLVQASSFNIQQTMMACGLSKGGKLAEILPLIQDDLSDTRDRLC